MEGLGRLQGLDFSMLGFGSRIGLGCDLRGLGFRVLDLRGFGFRTLPSRPR